jgi:hypothetical protein
MVVCRATVRESRLRVAPRSGMLDDGWNAMPPAGTVSTTGTVSERSW